MSRERSESKIGLVPRAAFATLGLAAVLGLAGCGDNEQSLEIVAYCPKDSPRLYVGGMNEDASDANDTDVSVSCVDDTASSKSPIRIEVVFPDHHLALGPRRDGAVLEPPLALQGEVPPHATPDATIELMADQRGMWDPAQATVFVNNMSDARFIS